MAFDLSKFLGASQLGAGIGGLFQKNPYRDANNYIGQIPGETNKYYDPYFQAGKGALDQLGGQYGDLLSNPGQKLNDIGSQYQQSPGFKFALEQALQGAGHAAAAGGLAGSPEHEFQNQSIATGLANQDYNNWLGQATGLYGQGLQGAQGLSQLGFNAGNAQADSISQALAQQAKYDAEKKNWQSQNTAGSIGNIIGGSAGLFF
jgi:hypothetical protein